MSEDLSVTSFHGHAHAEKNVPLLRVVEHAAKLAEVRNQRVFVVGGIVRDVFSHGRIGDADLDIVVEGEGIPFAHALTEEIGGTAKEHRTFCTAKLLPPFRPDVWSGCNSTTDFATPLSEIDLASARTEKYVRPGALPEVTLATIEDDLFRRDFSINALAVALSDFLLFCRAEISRTELQNRVVDPCHGIKDLHGNTLRILHPRSFIDDPTRLFRCVRYAVRLGFSVDDSTTHARIDAVQGGALLAISTKRIWNEVVACASEPRGPQMLELCGAWGLFERLPFSSPQVLDQFLSVIKRVHSLKRGELCTIEVVETLLAAAVVRALMPDTQPQSPPHESPLHPLQLPRPLQRRAAVLAENAPSGKGVELFESTELFGTLRWIVTGVS